MHPQAAILMVLTIISTTIQFTLLDSPGTLLAAALVASSSVWVLSLLLKDAGIIDSFWGILFIVVAYTAAITSNNALSTPVTYLLLMVSVWGIRLSLHIFIRSIGRPEDPRYAQWREEGGEHFWIRSLFTIFLLQGWIAWAVMAPVNKVILDNTANALTPLAITGIAIWLFGFAYQSIADYQLFKFQRDISNKGKLLTSGLWRYSRHPNYFAEIVMWWAIFVFCLSYGAAWFVIGPIAITHTLVKFSGSWMLEEMFKKTKPGFDEYQQRVPELIPSWLLPLKARN